MLNMLMRILRGAPRDRWIVYGKRGPHKILPRATLGVHKTCTSYEEALSWLMKVKLQHAHEGPVDAVIVHLVEGRDENMTRKVVYRMGDGRPWWD